MTKKNGRLRIIFDARAVNRRFAVPPATGAATAEALAQVEVPPEETLFVAQCDVKDFSYHLKIGPGLGRYFSLKPLRVGDVRAARPNMELPAGSLGYDDMIYPHLMVMPMGFSWAMYFAQRAHDTCLLRVPDLSYEDCLRPFRPPPGLKKEGGRTRLLAYADNGNFLDVCRNRCQASKDAGVSQLRAEGVPGPRRGER